MQSPLGSLLLLALVVVAFYFLIARPQSKRLQQQRQMQSSIQIGDEVLTAGGLVVTVVRLSDELLTVQLAPGVETQLNRRFVVSKQEPQLAADGDEGGEIEQR